MRGLGRGVSGSPDCGLPDSPAAPIAQDQTQTLQRSSRFAGRSSNCTRKVSFCWYLTSQSEAVPSSRGRIPNPPALNRTTISHLVVSSGPSVHTAASPAKSYVGSPRLASHLVRAFAHVEPSGVPATGSAVTQLSPEAARILDALNLEPRVEVVQILLPVLRDGRGWSAEQWWDVGTALHGYLHSHDVAVGNRRVYKNTIVLALGTAKPEHVSDLRWGVRASSAFADRVLNSGSQASPAFDDLLTAALGHHTSHARDLSLHALYSGSSGSKPKKPVPRDLVALYAAVAAASEGEGHALGDGKGRGGWRFGHLPMR